MKKTIIVLGIILASFIYEVYCMKNIKLSKCYEDCVIQYSENLPVYIEGVQSMKPVEKCVTICEKKN